jgi:hypothetical protein
MLGRERRDRRFNSRERDISQSLRRAEVEQEEARLTVSARPKYWLNGFTQLGEALACVG